MLNRWDVYATLALWLAFALVSPVLQTVPDSVRYGWALRDWAIILWMAWGLATATLAFVTYESARLDAENDRAIAAFARTRR